MFREKQDRIPKQNHSPEQIISKLREKELVIQGKTIPVAATTLGVSDQTYYR